MKALVPGLVALALALPVLAGDEPKSPTPEPLVSLVLGPGQATATPCRQGSSRTGGGNLHVTQPAPDTLSVTMTGTVAAKGHPVKPSVASLTCDLTQSFEVVFHAPRVKGAKLILWGRTVGLLRSPCPCGKSGGSAEISAPGHASVHCGPTAILALDLLPRAVAGGQDLSIHDREGPVWVPVGPGKYTLHQAFGIRAAHEKSFLGNAPASAEFAPDPALEAAWAGQREPFHGAAKKDFGFQVILKVVADEEADGKEMKQGSP